MRRGDIVTVAGGGYACKPRPALVVRVACKPRPALVVRVACKPRPALVVRDDIFDATESVTVCPFTSTEVDAPLMRVPVTADKRNGLGKDSFLMVDKITTVLRSNVGTVLGRLEATTLVEFERRLLVFLGFGT